MSNKYKNVYRGYLIDHHSPDPPVVDFMNLKYSQYEDAVKRACIDQLMVYCKDHWGIAYYPTKVGRIHPAIKPDYVERLREICVKNDIEFMAYYSLHLDTYAALNHPNWAVKDEDGRVQRIDRDGKKFHWVCENTGYRNYSIRYIQEIVKKFKPDSLFLDIVGHPFCLCNGCRSLFQERYNAPMPTDKMGKENMWRELLEFSNDSRYDCIKSMIFSAKESDANVAVSINGGHIHLTKKDLDLVDWVYAEPWCGPYLSAAFAQGFDQYAQIGPGTVSTVYDPPPASVFIIESSRIVSQGCRTFMFSPSQKPDGSLVMTEFDRLGKAYGEIQKYQNLLRNRDRIVDVGIVYSENSRLYDRDISHESCLEGTLITLSQSMYPFQIIPEWELKKRASTLSVLILPNMSCMHKDTAEVLRTFVKAGGTLIATHTTSLMDERGNKLENFQLNDLFGCDYVAENREYIGNYWGSYLKQRRSNHPIWKNVSSTELPTLPPYVQVGTKEGTVLATHILPCVKLTDETWVNWWAVPPKYETSDTAIHYNEYKTGKIVYISFPLFRSIVGLRNMEKQFHIHWPAYFVKNLLQWLLPLPSIKVETDYTHSLGSTYFQTKDGSKLIIHQINQSVDLLGGDVNPLGGGRIVICEDFFQPKSCHLIHPMKKEIAVEKGSGVYYIQAPPVELHNILVIEGEKIC